MRKAIVSNSYQGGNSLLTLGTQRRQHVHYGSNCEFLLLGLKWEAIGRQFGVFKSLKLLSFPENLLYGIIVPVIWRLPSHYRCNHL